MDKPIDIREAAENLEQCIPILLMFGMWEEAAQAKFLMHYIHETWELEQKLESRADFIQTESTSLAEKLRELRESGKLPNVGREGSDEDTPS